MIDVRNGSKSAGINIRSFFIAFISAQLSKEKARVGVRESYVDLRRAKGGVFSEPSFFFRTLPSRAHTSSHMSGHHLTTVRRAGGLGASVARDLRALRLWQSSRQWHAVPWSCIDAAPGCRALRRSSNNILMAWPGRVAQAPRAGRTRAPWSW